MTIGFYGSDPYGSGPYGSIPPPLGVLSAEALNGTHVQVNFTELLDFTFAPLTIPSNYSIPGLTVLSVEQAAENAVLLTTSPQTNIVYTVTVTAGRSTLGTLLDPLHNSAQFTGFPRVPGYFAVATAVRRVRAVFSTVMLNDSNLSNPANYTITDFNGNAVFVLSATPEQNIPPAGAMSVLLGLASNLGESDFYVCTVSSNIHTITGLEVLPPTSVFQWLQGDNQVQIPLGLFTGEVSQLGPLTDFGGLVYFSPALNTPTLNSIIQVEEVDVCTTAYDTYVLPAPIDPPVLFTYGGSLVSTPSPDPYLLNQCVLWAPFPRNFEAKIELGFTGAANQDQVPVPDDTSCSVLIKQQFAPGSVALLNDPAYYLLPKNSPEQSVPPMFITANNLAPIPPGPETILVLHVSMRGQATFTTKRGKKIGHTSATMAGSSQLFAGLGPPPVVLAQASISGGSNMSAVGKEVRGAAASIAGVATVNALATEGNPPPTVIFASSNLSAFGTVRRAVAAHLHPSSSVSAAGSVRRGVASSLQGAGVVVGTMKARWTANAAIQGTSSVIAIATVTHKAESFPTGIASVSATPT